jgi:hypothetical protein
VFVLVLLVCVVVICRWTMDCSPGVAARLVALHAGMLFVVGLRLQTGADTGRRAAEKGENRHGTKVWVCHDASLVSAIGKWLCAQACRSQASGLLAWRGARVGLSDSVRAR